MHAVVAVLVGCDRGCLCLVGWVGWGLVLGIGVLVCSLGVARFEKKRAGDLFPNHPKERTDSVRQ